jgi:hypothetical protein
MDGGWGLGREGVGDTGLGTWGLDLDATVAGGDGNWVGNCVVGDILVDKGLGLLGATTRNHVMDISR